MSRTLIEEVPQGDGLTKRVYDDGTIQFVDADGRFAPGGKMPPGTAASLPRSRKRLGDENDIADLLEELGLTGSTMGNMLANHLAQGGSGAVNAAKELINLARGKGGGLRWLDNDHISVEIDGRTYLQQTEFSIGPEAARMLVKLARQRMKELNDKKASNS